MKFSCHQIILREIDDEITEEELDEIICEVFKIMSSLINSFRFFQIDADNSNTIDFQEFIKIMS